MSENLCYLIRLCGYFFLFRGSAFRRRAGARVRGGILGVVWKKNTIIILKFANHFVNDYVVGISIFVCSIAGTI